MRAILAAAGVVSTAVLLPGSARAEEPTNLSSQEAGTWRVVTGVNYSQGDYGDTRDTEVESVPMAIKYRRGAFSLRVSTSWVHVQGPGSLIDTPQGRDAGSPSGGGDEDGSTNNYGGPGDDCTATEPDGGDESGPEDDDAGELERSGIAVAAVDDECGSGGGGGNGGPAPRPPFDESRSGMGDLALTLGYEFALGASTWLDVSTRIKFPTASRRKHIGTGKIDVTFGSELSHQVGGVTLHAGGRYRVIDSPAGRHLRDTYGFTGGASVHVGKLYFGSDYDWQRSATPGRGPSSEATGWINFALARNVRLEVYASTGFTTGSADLASGVSLSFRLH